MSRAPQYAGAVAPVEPSADWIACQDEPLPVAEAMAWAVVAHCGAVASFVGTVRDHAEGRPGVRSVGYEAYREEVVPKLASVAAAARGQWTDVGRIALLHRVGTLRVGEASVVVVVSAPHRAEAFAAARFCIDTVKEAAPIWKHEVWDGGTGWGLGARSVVTVGPDVAPRPAGPQR